MKNLGYLGLLCATFMFTSSMIGCGGADESAPVVQEEEEEHDEATEYGDEAPGEEGGVADAMKDGAAALKDKAGEAVEGAKEGMKEGADKIVEGVKEGADKVKEGAADLIDKANGK